MLALICMANTQCWCWTNINS